MDPSRAVAVAFVLSLTFSFAACFGAPTRRMATSGTHSASGTGGGGAAASTGTAVSGTGGAAGTGGTGMGGAGSGGAGPSGTTGSGGVVPNDGGYLDVAADAIGKGGLPEGATCGTYATGDGGVKCGAGLACCFPCKHMMCDSVCQIECNPKMPGCVGGCVPMP